MMTFRIVGRFHLFFFSAKGEKKRVSGAPEPSCQYVVEFALPSTPREKEEKEKRGRVELRVKPVRVAAVTRLLFYSMLGEGRGKEKGERREKREEEERERSKGARHFVTTSSPPLSLPFSWSPAATRLGREREKKSRSLG